VGGPGRWRRRQAAIGGHRPVVRTPLVSGYRGRPPRPGLAHAERGNPVGVRVFGPGRPIVRGAELLGGNRMLNKRMPTAERQRDSRPWCCLLLMAGRWGTGRIPALVAGLERALT